MWWFGCREIRTRTVADVNVKIEPKLSQTHQYSNQELINVLLVLEACQTLFRTQEPQQTYETNLVSVILFMQYMTKNNFQNYGSRSM